MKSSDAEGVDAVKPKLEVVLTRAHSIFLAASVSADLEAKLPRNFANDSVADLDSAMKYVTGGVKESKTVRSRVFEYDTEKLGVFVYSASKNHPMVPVTRLDKVVELVNNENTQLMIPDATSDVGGLKLATTEVYALLEQYQEIYKNPIDDKGALAFKEIFVDSATLKTPTVVDTRGDKVSARADLRRDLQQKKDGSGEDPLSYNNNIVDIKAAAKFSSWSDVKKYRIPLVNTPDFILKGFSGYATPEEVVIDRNPYYAVVETKKK
ncbi:MAG: hypothetical protein COV44_00745 [Deltaproteobacteria bacterium CG11_big_fil_rev_8_21_14_0_20_45_16]|nr:MAG: hypothetical protein COV44_00745 [Deltaproteobacteria bacterium CG11_big_fil_rev_8_21_14_0_20_45_16]